MSSEAERKLNEYLEKSRVSESLKVKKVTAEEDFDFPRQKPPVMPEGLLFRQGFWQDGDKSGFRIFNDEDEEVFAANHSSNPIIDPSDPDTLFFIGYQYGNYIPDKDHYKITKINLDDLASGAEPTEEVLTDIPVRFYSSFKIDPTGNFLIVMNPATDEYGFDPQGTVSIINKETLETAKTFRGVAGVGYYYNPLPLEIDNEGSIYYPGIKNREVKTTKIETNFLSLPSKGKQPTPETSSSFSAHRKPPGY